MADRVTTANRREAKEAVWRAACQSVRAEALTCGGVYRGAAQATGTGKALGGLRPDHRTRRAPTYRSGAVLPRDRRGPRQLTRRPTTRPCGRHLSETEVRP